MAMALREQGVPIKIVYLGHRDGSAVMVHKDSNIHPCIDLRGKRIAVPNRYSNQRLLIFRALKQAGMTVNDIELVEMPPPDMPAALYAQAVDAMTSGEPFMGQTRTRRLRARALADQGRVAELHLVRARRATRT